MPAAFGPACPACSKPFRSGTLVLFLNGEFYHVGCQSRSLQVEAIQEVDRARMAQAQSARLLDEATRRRRGGRTTMRGACPVCTHDATVTDWQNWIAIEGCECLGFFVQVCIIHERLPYLPTEERSLLATRVRRVRIFGQEAWVTTANGDPREPLVVRTERPDRPT